ncbi:5-(carboxyamino)imidazole ribonucleotide synthase [Candidatus Puniceispirillum marinum]|uniref:N5-carboxyaminoimidazole ribonucleotide synthase n=1 Tax=Puniceispirillum marinum (strain IMCC1322) TaxID=488538 RepID=D5BTI1_PUNMI|nr:5-(carboxyamino)imidazole ribonucleotide synthase [Candidatus Puniceispirillum marinum]ADE39578.1 Phosphoribosylaminoimidazole carboxylase, ATPase subunit [Candidatus Puniceispirillum marinum IMCC1322]
MIIGILGSGQLGRMLAIAAAQLGIKAHIFAPDANNSPAGDVAAATTEAAYDDQDALIRFANSVDVITSEFENVPAKTLDILSMHKKVSPGISALHTAQHRIREKTLARDLGIDTPAFWHITNAAALHVAMAELNKDGILKTCTLGYDGKGQARISPSSDLDAAFGALGSDDVILEEMIPFTAEASFLIARAHDGRSCVFPASLNQHKDGILDRSVAPAALDDTLIKAGTEAVKKLADALDLFGVMALECFITDGKRLLFNEIAPRPHNSFHWTIEGCATSQFTQLARVLAEMPFGSVSTYGQWQMDNLLGEHMDNVPALLASDHIHVHLYGKSGAKKGRKMGHTNRQITP